MSSIPNCSEGIRHERPIRRHGSSNLSGGSRCVQRSLLNLRRVQRSNSRISQRSLNYEHITSRIALRNLLWRVLRRVQSSQQVNPWHDGGTLLIQCWHSRRYRALSVEEIPRPLPVNKLAQASPTGCFFHVYYKSGGKRIGLSSSLPSQHPTVTKDIFKNAIDSNRC